MSDQDKKVTLGGARQFNRNPSVSVTRVSVLPNTSTDEELMAMSVLEKDLRAASEFSTDFMRWRGRESTGKFQHWCPDWDYLPIDDECVEFEACTCIKENRYD